MTQPYVGQMQLFGFNFAPSGWQQCNGQLLPISQYAALFSIIGTYYGGNGTSNFALPNMQGNVAVGVGQGIGLSQYVQGETGGGTSVTVTTSTMARHNHTLVATTTATGTTATAAGNQLAVGSAGGGKQGGTAYAADIYSPNAASATTGLAPLAISLSGGNGAHNNMQPYLALNYCIAIVGVFPPRN